MSTELRELGRAIKQAQWRHHRALDRALTDIGSTIVQWDALRAISEHPDASAHDLALTTFQSDQAFGTLAKRLLERQLIERVPGRGRRIEHHLTDTGRDILRQGEAIASAIFEKSFAGLDESQRATLASLLARVGGN